MKSQNAIFVSLTTLLIVLFASSVYSVPVLWEGKKITKSQFNRIYSEQKVNFFRFNSQILKCENKTMQKPVRGEWGIGDFYFKDVVKKDSFQVYCPSMVAKFIAPDGTETYVCVEWFMNITGWKEAQTVRTACLVYIGTYKYKGKRIPLLKACPMLTKYEFKRYLQGRL